MQASLAPPGQRPQPRESPHKPPAAGCSLTQCRRHTSPSHRERRQRERIGVSGIPGFCVPLAGMAPGPAANGEEGAIREAPTGRSSPGGAGLAGHRGPPGQGQEACAGLRPQAPSSPLLHPEHPPGTRVHPALPHYQPATSGRSDSLDGGEVAMYSPKHRHPPPRKPELPWKRHHPGRLPAPSSRMRHREAKPPRHL